MKNAVRLSVLLVVLLVVVYVPLILQQNDFRTDDYYLLALVQEKGLVHPFDGQRYEFYSAFRVIPMLTFLVDVTIHAGRPLGYYLTNLVIHNAAMLLLFFVLLEIFRRFFSSERPLLAFLLALAAGLHADLFYNVLWISNRTESLLLLCYLLAVYASLRFFSGGGWKWYAPAFVATLLALLTKEQALHLPLLYLIVGVAASRAWGERLPLRRVIMSALPLALLAAAFLLLRMAYDPAAQHMVGVFGAKKLFSTVGILLMALQPSLAAPVFDVFVTNKLAAAAAGVLLASLAGVLVYRLSAHRRRVVLVLLLLLVTIMLPRVFYHILPRINSIQVVFLLFLVGVAVLRWKPSWSSALLLLLLAGQVYSMAILLPQWRHETSNARYHALLEEERDTGPRRYCLVTSYHNFGAYAMNYFRHGTFGEDSGMYRTPLYVDRRYGTKPGPEYTVAREGERWVFTSTDPRAVFLWNPRIAVPAGMRFVLDEPAADYGRQRAVVTITPAAEAAVYLIERNFLYEKLEVRNAVER